MNASCTSTLPSYGASSVAAPWGEIWSHRSYLVRFAQRRLRDPVLAEDVVHDVFEAVISGRAAFAGRSALRSWLTAILKHKIVDLVRQRSPLESATSEDDEAEFAAVASEQPQPDEIAEHRERLAHTLARIELLPLSLRQAITLRVLHDQGTEEVCATLEINENNLFQRLFRARRQLASLELCH